MFAFIINPQGCVDARLHIQAMMGALRGNPSPANCWIDDLGGIAVGAAASGILQEDAFDRQPVISADLVFAAQARLDNRDEILQRLDAPRATWPVTSDAEVLFRAYRKWGEECVQELAGDYAFAAFHRESGRTVAAVDHLGSVRLYYAECNGTLVLSPQLDVLLQHPGIPREPDLAALGLLMAPKMIPGTTAFTHVQSLPGGHLLIRENGRTRTRRWWQPDAGIEVRYRDTRDYVSEANEIFSRAVSDRLRTTGEVHTTLSGGLDSTLVADRAATLLQAQERRLTAYTSVPQPGISYKVPPGRDTDDWSFASAAASRHGNMTHVAISGGIRCALDILDGIHRRSRTPVRNSANQVWLGEMAIRSAETGARVLLTGNKGNATISYSGEGAVRDLFLRRRWMNGLSLAVRISQWNLVAAAGLVTHELFGPKSEHGTAGLRRSKDRLRPGSVYLTSAFRREQEEILAQQSPGLRERNGMLRFMMNPEKTWGADPLPQWNVEFRDPTGDRRLIERLMSFPPEAFLVGGRRRGLARAMAEGRLAEKVRLRRNRGAQVPELAGAIALQAPAYREALGRIAHSALCQTIVDVNAMRGSLDRIVGGHAAGWEPPSFHRAIGVCLFIAGEGW